jgi:hypothetical protein
MFSRRPGPLGRFNRRGIGASGGGGPPALGAVQSFTVEVIASALSPLLAVTAFDLDIVAQEGSGYSPADEGSAVLHFDMQTPAGFTLNGGSTGITQIQNLISTAQWSTPVNDTPYEATGLNGYPCLHPLVTGDRLLSTSANDAAVAALYEAASPT